MELNVGLIGAGASQSRSVPQRGLGDLSTDQFLQIMITELQQQDPLEPVKNQDLLAQVSQIRSLEMTTQLNESFKTLLLQQQIEPPHVARFHQLLGDLSKAPSIARFSISTQRIPASRRTVPKELSNIRRVFAGPHRMLHCRETASSLS